MATQNKGTSDKVTKKTTTTTKKSSTTKPKVKKRVDNPIKVEMPEKEVIVLEEPLIETKPEETKIDIEKSIIKNKRNKKETTSVVKVIDNETSEDLKEIKNADIVNKEKQITSEEADKNTVEEPPVIEVGIERYLDVDYKQGLGDAQVELRVSQGLTNVDNSDKGKSIFEIVMTNVFTIFNILYLIITIILIVLKRYNNLTFLGAIIPNLILGVFQEIRAKITVDKMKIMSAPVAIVIRNGNKIEIPVTDVVLDDVIFYSAGKQICADSIILNGNVEVNEALLTGEADAIPKIPGDKVLSGSFISSGVCVCRVDRVGKDCYIAKMSSDAKKYSPPKSELLNSLRRIIKTISFLLLPIAVLYMLSHLNGNYSWDSFKGSFQINIETIAYIILALIPAGLLLLTSIALYTGVYRLSKSHTLVQELYCIEMLARVDTLCLDKTGTLTDGTMRVCDCIEVNNHTDYTIREIVGSMMSAFEDTNPTSEALIKFFDKNEVLTPIEVIPFSSKRKFSAVTFESQGMFILGAPDFVIKDNYEKIASKVERFSSQGCRVLVLGFLGTKIKKDELPKNVKPLALIVIQDHIREDASDTISFFKQNGVDIKIISGDNPETVAKIAERVGVSNASRFINLNGLTDDEIKERVFDYTVFGRVTPSQKKLIVQTLKSNGKTVAMTGDGVNDILALKEADCSIAMASGSEATRYVSHLVLMDSNFASMPKVVLEGRRVINNIQKTSSLYLTKNLFAFLIAIMYIIIGFVYHSNVNINTNFPFQASNLIIIEFVILGVATTALAVQPNRALIKGHFLGNVIKEILPGALAILVFQIILFFAQRIPGTDGNEFLFGSLQNISVFQTLSTIITTLIMLNVLKDTCKPFNAYRKVVYGFACLATILIFVVPQLRGIISCSFTDFGSTEWLLLLVLVQAIYPIMYVVKYLLELMHLVPKKND